MFGKIIKVVFVCCFAVLIIVPFLLSDMEGGKVLETQNRVSAVFPQLTVDDNHTFSDLTSELEDWCGDNIGYRDEFNTLYTMFNFRFLGLPSNRVHIGRNGWYFTTHRNNVEIAKGTHVITEDDLEKIAHYQAIISDYYKKQGKEYYLVLIPAKPSVYPEYISGGNFGVIDTTVDIVEDYLLKNTDVKVINLKSDLLSAKGGSDLYYRTDAHWRPYGAYIGYQTIMNRLYNDGVVDKIVDFSPELVKEGDVRGDLSNMIGNNALPKEDLFVYSWEANYKHDITSSDYHKLDEVLNRIESDGIIEIARSESKYINESGICNDKSLLLYADSMYEDILQGNQFFAENFSNFQYVRVRQLSRDIDETVDPDIVIFECYERLIEDVLTRKPLVNIEPFVNSLIELPAQISDIWIGRNGLYVECKEASINGKIITLDPDYDSYTFYGWAVDFNNEANLGDLFLRAGDTYMNCGYGLKSNDVSEHFDLPNIKNSRYRFTLTAEQIKSQNITEFTFIMVSSDGEYKYEPVTYTIQMPEQYP